MYNKRMNLSLGEKLNSAKGGLAYSVNVCFYIVLNLIASVIIAACGLRDGDGNMTDGAIYIAFLVSPAAIALTLALTVKVGKVGVREFFPVKCKPKYYAIALLLIFGLLFSLSEVNGYFLELLKHFGYTQKLTESSIPNLQGWRIVSAIAVIAVLPAVMEEALFRGVILGGAERGAGSVRAVFIVGFVFALFHGSAEQTLYQFVCGCLFALLAIRSRSVLPSVLMHFINNALILIFTACGLVDELGNLALSQGASVALTVLSAVSLVVAVVWLIADKTRLEKCEKGGVKRFFAFAALGIAVMALIWILGLFGL